MQGPQSQYTTELYKRFGYLATWTPATPVSIGDVGEMDGNVFRRVSSLKEMNVPFTVRQAQNKEDLIYTSESGVSLSFKAAGSPVVSGSSLLVQKAGAMIDFHKGAGVVFIAKGCLSPSIEDQILLGKELIRRYNIGEWKAKYVVVTEIKKADSMSAFISESSGGKIELIAENSLQLGTLSLADLNINFAVGASRGINTQIIAKDKLTPLFRVRQVKASFWRGTSFSVKDKSFHNLDELPPEIEIAEEDVELVDFTPDFGNNP
jgi:hypothetical protein